MIKEERDTELTDRQRRLDLLNADGDAGTAVRAVFSWSGDPAGEAQALNGLGEASLAIFQPERARIDFTAALDLARRIGDMEAQARARRGLSHSLRPVGDPADDQ